MKIHIFIFGAVVVGINHVLGHQHHSHDENDGGERNDPLKAQEYSRDTLEELERKWSFEVSLSFHLFSLN